MTSDTAARVRQVLAEHAGLEQDPATIAADADLFDAGMTSHASVNVMLGLEDEFDVEFPDELLHRSTFTSVASIEGAVNHLQNG